MWSVNVGWRKFLGCRGERVIELCKLVCEWGLWVIESRRFCLSLLLAQSLFLCRRWRWTRWRRGVCLLNLVQWPGGGTSLSSEYLIWKQEYVGGYTPREGRKAVKHKARLRKKFLGQRCLGYRRESIARVRIFMQRQCHTKHKTNPSSKCGNHFVLEIQNLTLPLSVMGQSHIGSTGASPNLKTTTRGPPCERLLSKTTWTHFPLLLARHKKRD